MKPLWPSPLGVKWWQLSGGSSRDPGPPSGQAGTGTGKGSFGVGFLAALRPERSRAAELSFGTISDSV